MTKFFVCPIGGCPGVAEGIRMASMSRRSIRTQNEWKVEMTGLAMLSPPTSFSTRSPISAAALLVNVIAKIDSGMTPLCSIKYAIRYVMTRVLPLPAPARISTGPSVVSTASRCCGLSWSRKDNAEVAPESLLRFYRGIAPGGIARLISGFEFPKIDASDSPYQARDRTNFGRKDEAA